VEVVVEHLLPAGDGFVQQRDSAVRTGTVDEGVDAAELLGDRGDEPFAIARARYVGVDRERGRALRAYRSRGLSGTIAARAVTECDSPALSGELEPNTAPDAFGAASDQRDASIVLHNHSLRSACSRLLAETTSTLPLRRSATIDPCEPP
jgi:hypothetical protein